MCTGRVVHMKVGAIGDQKTVPDPLELELQAVVGHPAGELGTEF